jgi:hypothetical protein
MGTNGCLQTVSSICVRPPASLAHRIAFHLDPVGFVYEPIEDAVGQSGIAYLFMPAHDW